MGNAESLSRMAGQRSECRPASDRNGGRNQIGTVAGFASEYPAGFRRNPHTIARFLTVGRDRLSKSESVTVAAIEAGVPLLVEARDIVATFQAMIRKRSLGDLEPWLERARSSLVASFASGVVKDQAAVAAAITSPWSNGPTDGQITKLKLVKRQMYGRGKLDLLQARVIGAA
jgi:transposase